VLTLEWRNVNFEAGTVSIDVGATKNKRGRKINMTLTLRQLLTEQQGLADTLKREQGVIPCRVFTTKDGKPIKSFYKAWKTACRKAGCPGRILHDFRRTAIRNFVRTQIPASIAMQISGHRTRSVFDRYDITSDDDMQHAAEMLDDAAQGQKRDKPTNARQLRAGA